MDLQKELSTALTRAMLDAVPSTPSGSHKILVVGQLVVNLPAEAPIHRQAERRCCGKCHN